MNIFYLIIALSAFGTIGGMLKKSYLFKKDKPTIHMKQEYTPHETGELQWDEYGNPQISGE